MKKRSAKLDGFSTLISLPTEVSTSHDQVIDKVLDPDTNSIIPIVSYQINNIRTAVEHLTLYEVSSDVGQQSLPVPSFIPASSQIVGYQSAAPTYSHTVRVAIPNSSSDFNTLALSSAKKHLVLSAILSGVYVHQPPGFISDIHPD